MEVNEKYWKSKCKCFYIYNIILFLDVIYYQKLLAQGCFEFQGSPRATECSLLAISSLCM